MPVISIDVGKLDDKEKKRALIKALTDAAEGVLKIERRAFTVLVRENCPDNIGVGGELLSDLHAKK